MKVLIAGGGPTGLTLGIDLARRGVEVEPVLASGQLTTVGCEDRLLTGQVFSASQAMTPRQASRTKITAHRAR